VFGSSYMRLCLEVIRRTTTSLALSLKRFFRGIGGEVKVERGQKACCCSATQMSSAQCNPFQPSRNETHRRATSSNEKGRIYKGLHLSPSLLIRQHLIFHFIQEPSTSIQHFSPFPRTTSKPQPSQNAILQDSRPHSPPLRQCHRRSQQQAHKAREAHPDTRPSAKQRLRQRRCPILLQH